MYVCTTGTPGVCRGEKPPCVRPRFSRIPALRTAARQTGKPRFSQRLCFQTVAQCENNKQYCPDKVRISFKRNMLFVFTLRHHAKTVRVQKSVAHLVGHATLSLFPFVTYYSPGLIAPLGHTSAQVPQSTHTLGSIEYFSPSLIAPLGHSSMHVPHATQSSLIT